MKKHNAMNIKSNKELVFGHSILHSWAKHNWRRKPANWNKAQVKTEHARLIKLMKQRNMKHSTPL